MHADTFITLAVAFAIFWVSLSVGISINKRGLRG